MGDFQDPAVKTEPAKKGTNAEKSTPVVQRPKHSIMDSGEISLPVISSWSRAKASESLNEAQGLVGSLDSRIAKINGSDASSIAEMHKDVIRTQVKLNSAAATTAMPKNKQDIADAEKIDKAERSLAEVGKAFEQRGLSGNTAQITSKWAEFKKVFDKEVATLASK